MPSPNLATVSPYYRQNPISVEEQFDRASLSNRFVT
jgi:hypothetical protein